MKRHEIKKRPLSPAALAVLRRMAGGWILIEDIGASVVGIQHPTNGTWEHIHGATFESLRKRGMIAPGRFQAYQGRYTLSAAGREATAAARPPAPGEGDG